MRRIPWHLAWRSSRKGALTVLGVALGVAFSFASVSVASALELDTAGIARHHPGSAIVIHARDGTRFDMARLDGFPNATGVRLADGTTLDGEPVVLVALVGASVPATDPGVAYPGPSSRSQRIRAFGHDLEAGGSVSHPEVAPGWYLVAPSTIPGPMLVDSATLAGATEADEARLRELGFDTARAPALQSFFAASGREVARDLVLVVVFTSALAAIFCYEFLRSEVRESRRDIGIWRALGMRAREVSLVFLARAAAIAALALAIGAGAAYALLLAGARLTGADLLETAVGPRDGALIAAAFLTAALAGGLLPALAAGRISVQATMESAP